MTIQEQIDLERDYRRVVADRHARGVAYWRERFAQISAEPERRVRMFTVPPVTQMPSSHFPRYVDLEAKRDRPKMGNAEKLAKKRAYMRKVEAEKRAARLAAGPKKCIDCGEPTNRCSLADRCKECANKRRAHRTTANSRKKYRETHEVMIIPREVAVEIPALAESLRAKRGAQHAATAAQEIGICFSSYRAVEAGRQRPSLLTLRKLCAWLGSPPEVFLRAQPDCGHREPVAMANLEAR